MNYASYKIAVEKLLAAESASFEGSFSQEELMASAARIEATLEIDVDRVLQEKDLLFSPKIGVEAGKNISYLFMDWRAKPVSTVAILYAAAEVLKIDTDSKEFIGAVIAGIAADVPSTNAYHDNNHFREVTAMMARLCNINQKMCQTENAPSVLLNGPDMSKCLMAAAAHDLLHDGGDNTLNGKHQQYRIEDISIKALDPLMNIAGFTAEEQEDMRVMIRITDVSAPDSSSQSPHDILNSVCNTTFKNTAAPDSSLPEELKSLSQDKKLVVMAGLMSAADLGPSLATTPEFARMLAGLLAQERGVQSSTTRDLQFFLSHIVKEKEISSPEGNHLTKETLTNLIFNVSDSKKPSPPRSSKSM